jgi:hypothetical protein
MRWRLVALISLGVNFALLVALLALRGHAPAEPTGARIAQVASTNIAPTKPNVIIRRQFFSWQDLESADYPTYIANLRDIGCPEQTIRDIIIADVNALFAKRLATELVTPGQQWWRAEPDPAVEAVAAEKMRLIEGERRDLLASLLGPAWETGDLANLPRPSRQGVALDGPVLGMMTSETKQTVQDVAVRSEERLNAYIENAAAEGREPDPSVLAKLRQQTRDELAKVLTPAQLEEYQLRYSDTADNLRQRFGELEFFNATPDEFRQVFRATENIEQQLSLLGDSADPNVAQMRKTLTAQRENAIRTALGNRRYEEYRMLQDADYREAVAQAREAGTPEAARTIYTINLAAAAEQNSILSNTNLTAEQKDVELKQLELDQLKANTLAAGKELPPEQPPPPVMPQPRTYTVRPGENAAVIGMLHGVPLNMLRDANPNVDLNRLRPGDILTVPRSPAPTPPLPVPFPR